MDPTDKYKGERVTRETLPTIAFTALVSHKRWIDEQAQARKVSKSEVIRDALDLAMGTRPVTTDTDMRVA